MSWHLMASFHFNNFPFDWVNWHNYGDSGHIKNTTFVHSFPKTTVTNHLMVGYCFLWFRTYAAQTAFIPEPDELSYSRGMLEIALWSFPHELNYLWPHVTPSSHHTKWDTTLWNNFTFHKKKRRRQWTVSWSAGLGHDSEPLFFVSPRQCSHLYIPQLNQLI